MKLVFLLGAVLSTACSSKMPAAMAYVTNNDLSSISVFHVDAESGMLTMFGTVPTPAGGATYCELHPSSPLLFVDGQFGGVLESFSLQSNGMPSLVAGSAVQTGANPHVLALDPGGQFLYVANTSSASVSAWRVGAAGMLNPIPGSPFAAGATPYDVKVSDSGKYAYAVNRDSEDVSAYAIDASTGALQPIAGSPFAVGCPAPPCGPRALAFSPAGNFAFVPNRFSSTVTVFAVDAASGRLTIVPGSPFPAGSDPRSAAVHPSGRYVYVANTVSNDVTAFAVDTSGALRQIAAYPAGAVPLSLEIDEAGKFLYAANSASNSISIYRVDSATGRLTTAGTVATPGSPVSIALR